MEMDKFLDIMSHQIRNDRARSMAVKEIKNHIQDQAETYEAMGMSKREAYEEAVRQMGDPVSAGVELDRIHRPKMEWRLFWWIVGFGILGLVIQYLCVYRLGELTGGTMADFVRQCMYTVLGLMVMAAVCLCDYSILGKCPELLGACFLGGIVIICMSGILIMYNGSYPYLRYVIYLFVPVYGGILYKNRGKGAAGFGISIYWIGAVFFTGVRIIGGGLSVTVNAVAACSVMFLIAVWKEWFGISRKAGMTAAFVLAAAAGLIFFGNLRPYQLKRLEMIFHPKNYVEGYQIELVRKVGANLAMNRSSYEILEQRGLMGLWNGYGLRSEYMLLQSAAVLGTIKILMLSMAYGAFSIYLFWRAVREKNHLGQMAGIGCAVVLTAEIVNNMLLNLGIGFSFSGGLPFLSYGKIHTLVVYGILGILLSIYRYRNLVWNEEIQEEKREREKGLRIGDYVIHVEKRGKFSQKRVRDDL